MPDQSLLTIVAHARSGALEQAWRLFRQAGLETVEDDPAVLSVRGRLQKDRARQATGEDRRRGLAAAADSYAAAAILQRDTYPLINAASLAFLAGDSATAHERARLVLAWLERDDRQPDTPYYEAATRAEALLLLGDLAGARSALDAAVDIAPRAWEDHVTTLRQFRMILRETGGDETWLAGLAPPRSLHFAGHLGPMADEADLRRQVDAFLLEKTIGFAFGAPGAGADLVIAEAVLDYGAELTLVIPGSAESFRNRSVLRFGAAWGARHDAVVARAQRIVFTGVGDTPASLQLAGETAMGLAVMQAAALADEAVQLLVPDPAETGAAALGGSAWAGETWAGVRPRGRTLAAARGPGGPGDDAPMQDPAVLVARLSIAVPLAGADDPDALVRDLAAVLLADPKPLAAPVWTETVLRAAYTSPAGAAKAALAILAAAPWLRIAADYSLVRRIECPSGGPTLLLGLASPGPDMVLASTPPGAIHVTETFAAALRAVAPDDAAVIEQVGELPAALSSPVVVFALSRA